MPTRRTPANRNHAVLRLLKQTVRTDWRAHSHAADTQCWGQEHNPPSHALHVEDKRRVLGLGTIKTHKPPLRREGGAKLEKARTTLACWLTIVEARGSTLEHAAQQTCMDAQTCAASQARTTDNMNMLQATQTLDEQPGTWLAFYTGPCAIRPRQQVEIC